MAKAVNTLYPDQTGGLVGDNTDGVGLIRDLTVNYGVSVNGADVLVLGAGGAVRGVLGLLASERPRSITLINRTRERAEQLKQDFAEQIALEVLSYGEETGRRFDLIINGTVRQANRKAIFRIAFIAEHT